MDCTSRHISYSDTGFFSRIVTDYVAQQPELRPFYEHPVAEAGIADAIAARRQFATNRELIVDAFRQQYSNGIKSPAVQHNIDSLQSPDTFTIVTAHQPNIFTGHLYFIYKIVHAIRIADHLNATRAGEHFVPVFYMGSEDADLDELGNIQLGGEKLIWDTKQTGAVGRMKTDGLDQILNRISGEIAVLPNGENVVKLLREFYLNSPDVQTATFRFVDHLFSRYGLLVLIPDNAALKQTMQTVFEEDLFAQKASSIVDQTINQLSVHYKVQANPRDINLFYLKDDLRGRIEKRNDRFYVHESTLSFSDADMRRELADHPERFSPNVILRGIFQETILPNIAFIGGGGELAYWLELKALFHHYQVPFPMLILRNSFVLVEKKWRKRLDALGICLPEIFQGERKLLNDLVRKHSGQRLELSPEKEAMKKLFATIETNATATDPTLQQYVKSLEVRGLQKLVTLEKKLLKAEKRKFSDQQRQLNAAMQVLFPGESLQERVDNFIPFYARYGDAFINKLYEVSNIFKQDFTILETDDLLDMQ